MSLRCPATDFTYMHHKMIIMVSLVNNHHFMRDSLVAQLVKNLPAMQETLVQFLGWEDPLEKG